MQFTFFSLLFLIIVLILFYFLRVEMRPYILAIASAVYPFFLSKEAGITIIIFSSAVYVAGLILGKFKKSLLVKRLLVGVFVGAIAILLLVGKNIPWFLNRIGNNAESSYTFLIPIGFSFYAFQAISYLIDIYVDKIQPMINPIYFHLYMSWFPKFISGPIESAGDFFEKLSKISSVRFFILERLKKSVMYILVGCFYKMVIADRLAIPVAQVFDLPKEYSGWILLLAAILYTVQIYCDFAGYSMFVMGISELFGIELVENFNTPYLATNIKDFWNRWHISLSNWLQEYIYIPLGGNRKGIKCKCFNIMCVFVISGIWHGAGWSFVIWGILHGIYSIVDLYIENKQCRIVREGFIGRIIVFTEVTIAWIFFKSSNATSAIKYMIMILTNHGEDSLICQLSSIGINISMLKIIFFIFIFISFIIMELFFYKKGMREIIDKLTFSQFLSLVWILSFAILVFGIYGPDASTTEMIYMNF